MEGVNQLTRCVVDRFGPLFEPLAVGRARRRGPTARSPIARSCFGGRSRPPCTPLRASASSRSSAPIPTSPGKAAIEGSLQELAAASRPRPGSTADARRVRGVSRARTRPTARASDSVRRLRARAHEGVDPAGRRRRATRAHARRGGARGAGRDPRRIGRLAAPGAAVRISYGKLRVPVHRIDGDDVFACEVEALSRSSWATHSRARLTPRATTVGGSSPPTR